MEDTEQENGEEQEMLDVELALQSAEYKKYLNACQELQCVDILNLSRPQKVAFFLNVYQCMYVHHFLKKMHEEGTVEESDQNQGGGGLLGQIQQYVFQYQPKPFYYNIAGFNFNLEEIKHGLLRSNTKSPDNFLKSISANDDRLSIINDFFDARVNFICLDYPESLELIDSFEGSSEEKLEEELESFI